MNAQQMNEALLPTNDAGNGTACANCMAASEGLVACSACKHARYCNRECQKANWKEHKFVCKMLKSFRLVSPGIPVPPGMSSFRPGRHGLRQRFVLFQKVFETSPDNPLASDQMIEMPKDIPSKIWAVTDRFVSSARCCSVCLKTEYDVPIGESKDWLNCKKCNYGWCCSEEHWTEYEPRHTERICGSYVECTSLDHFQYNHTRKHGDTFLHMPTNVRSEPMETLPRDWKEYFETRCPEEYAMKDMLPKEFFPAATHPLSQAANCLYAMYKHDKELFTTMEDLTIHVVGSAEAYEMAGGGPNCVWEEVMHCLPSVKRMHVAFVGPETCSIFADGLDKYDATDISCCPDCVGKARGRTQAFCGKTYHEFAQDKEIFTKPDLIVAFNTGMFEEETESWKTSLEVILDFDVPCLFTSYDRNEADGDFAVLSELKARTLTDGPVLNPFAVNYLQIDNSEVDKFFKVNMYCICFRGRN